MTKLLSMNRRNFLQASAAGALRSAMPGLIGSSAAAQTALTVGFIYVGPKDDYGYNQAHAEGAAVIKALPGVTLVEEENVPETVDVQKTMESMINLDGATLLFPTSFGYFDPHMLAVAAKHPDIQFRHCGGLWQEGKNPANTGSYFGYIFQGQYLNGIAASAMRRRARRSASSPPSRSHRFCRILTPSCSAHARSILVSPAR